MADQRINDALEAVDLVSPNRTKDDGMSLESLSLLVYSQKMRSMEDKVRDLYADVKQRQNTIRFLHELLKMINKETDSKGNLDIRNHPELQELIDRARELGVELPEGKTQFNREEREHLVDNLRMTCDDLNLTNEMKMQTIQRMTNEFYEVINMAKMIQKHLDEPKTRTARMIAG